MATALCKTRKINDEVLYADQTTPEVRAADIDALKTQGALNPRRTIRLCTHRTVDDALHEMFIVHSKSTYVTPHKHQNKVESSHVIEGEMDVVLFDDQGAITRVVRMGPYGSGKVFYFRLSEPIFHTMIMRSERVTFHETTIGPFRKDDCFFAPFAPGAGAPREEQQKYIDSLIAQADRF